MGRITKEEVEKMRELRKKGVSYSKISMELKVGIQTVMYNLSKKYREKTKIRARRNYKPRPSRKEYSREYAKKRYNEDEEFREKQKQRSRKYWRKNAKKREKKNEK